MLRIAIQKSGRLYEESVKLLKECGIQLNNGNKQLKTTAENFPLEVFFLRDDDIPQYVFDSVADIGIVGENVLLEKNKDIDLIYKLGFGKCRLSIAVPKGMEYNSLKDIDGYFTMELPSRECTYETIYPVSTNRILPPISSFYTSNYDEVKKFIPLKNMGKVKFSWKNYMMVLLFKKYKELDR